MTVLKLENKIGDPNSKSPGRRISRLNTNFSGVMPVVSCTDAVSYTHLDVYKRQI